MTSRNIVLYPDSILRKRSVEVESEDKTIISLLEDMIQTLQRFGGLGLAAPQIGTSKRVIVLANLEHMVLINPVVEPLGAWMDMQEGCLSFRGLTCRVRRAGKIKVSALDHQMNPTEFIADGLVAQAVQHEVDHLNGKLIIDYLPDIKRRDFVRKLQKR